MLPKITLITIIGSVNIHLYGKWKLSLFSKIHVVNMKMLNKMSISDLLFSYV